MSVVDEVKGRLDIVDIVSSYVPSLQKAGRTYKGLCPFHNEKTPSFVVFPESQNWHCFGACGTGGDVFSFVMRQEAFEFRQALEILADKAGVVLQTQTPEVAAADQVRQKHLDLLAVAAHYFQDRLQTAPSGQFTRAYLSKRGLSADIIHQFQLGFAENQWEALKSFLQQKGYQEADLLAVGLVVERDDGSPGYDRFRNRLMIPIRDDRGRVVGFGARALHEDQVPKYLNSPQTAVFDKSAILYGLDMAKASIRDTGRAIIVEGYLDVLQAHQQGCTNVIAQMGTALTETQLKQLKRHADTLILALDADKAGGLATLRGINTAREALDEVVPVPTARGLIRYENRLNADIRVATLPDGQDPDDILRTDLAAWQALLNSALPIVEYYIQQLAITLDVNTGKGKSKAVQTLMPLIQEIGDSVEQDHYLRQLATLVKIDERTLRHELQRTPQSQSKPTNQTTATRPIIQPNPASTDAKPLATQTSQVEEYCLAILVSYPTILAKVNRRLQAHEEPTLSADDFLKTENKALFQSVETWSVYETASLDTLLPLIEGHLEGHFANIMALWHQQPTISDTYVEKQLTDSVLRLRLERLKQQSQELRELQNRAYSERDKTATIEYMRLMHALNLRLSKLNKAKDALSILGRRRLEEKYH